MHCTCTCTCSSNKTLACIYMYIRSHCIHACIYTFLLSMANSTAAFHSELLSYIYIRIQMHGLPSMHRDIHCNVRLCAAGMLLQKFRPKYSRHAAGLLSSCITSFAYLYPVKLTPGLHILSCWSTFCRSHHLSFIV